MFPSNANGGRGRPRSVRRASAFQNNRLLFKIFPGYERQYSSPARTARYKIVFHALLAISHFRKGHARQGKVTREQKPILSSGGCSSDGARSSSPAFALNESYLFLHTNSSQMVSFQLEKPRVSVQRERRAGTTALRQKSIRVPEHRLLFKIFHGYERQYSSPARTAGLQDPQVFHALLAISHFRKGHAWKRYSRIFDTLFGYWQRQIVQRHCHHHSWSWDILLSPLDE